MSLKQATCALNPSPSPTPREALWNRLYPIASVTQRTAPYSWNPMRLTAGFQDSEVPVAY